MPTFLSSAEKPTTQLSSDANSVKTEAKSVDDWVLHLEKVGIKNPSISQLKGFGMGQDKAQKVRDKLKEGLK